MDVPNVILRIAQKIEDNTGEAYFSGGLPHDIVYNQCFPHDSRENTDYDIEVYNLTFDQIVKILNPLGKVSLDGKEFSVLNLHIDGHIVQLSLPMGYEEKITGQELADHIADGGKTDEHHLIKRTPDPLMSRYMACARREHTNKSMLMRILTSELYDPFGAEEHIRTRTFDVIRISTSDQGSNNVMLPHAFVVDPVRVLRAAVYRSRYNMTPSEDILACSKSMSDSFSKLTKDRVFKEWIKIFGYPNPSLALKFLDRVDWLKHFPYVWAMKFVIQDPEWHPEGNLDSHVYHAIDHGEKMCNELGITGRRKEAIVHGILLHDIGKLTSTSFEDGRVRSRGHHTSGDVLIYKIFDQYGSGHEMFLDIALDASREHMICYTVMQPEVNLKKLVRRYYNRRRELSLQELGIVISSDHSARPPLPGGMPEPFERVLSAEKELVDESGKLRKPLVTGRHILEWLKIEAGPIIGEIKEAASDAESEGVFSELAEAKVWVTNFHRELTHEESGKFGD